PAPASSFIFREFIAAFRRRRRCIALDYPGFGLSTGRAGFGYSLLERARIVARFVEALNLDAITLVVHDAGGPIGLRAAATAPERYRAFVLSDTFGFPLDDFPLVRAALRFVSGSRLVRILNRRLNLLPRLASTVAPVRRRLGPGVRQVYR